MHGSLISLSSQSFSRGLSITGRAATELAHAKSASKADLASMMRLGQFVGGRWLPRCLVLRIDVRIWGDTEPSNGGHRLYSVVVSHVSQIFGYSAASGNTSIRIVATNESQNLHCRPPALANQKPSSQDSTYDGTPAWLRDFGRAEMRTKNRISTPATPLIAGLEAQAGWRRRNPTPDTRLMLGHGNCGRASAMSIRNLLREQIVPAKCKTCREAVL